MTRVFYSCICTQLETFCVLSKMKPLHDVLLKTIAWLINYEKLSAIVWTPVQYVTLHFRDRRGAASLPHRNRAATIVLCVNRSPIRYEFRGRLRVVPIAFFLRDSSTSETRARLKIAPREKGETRRGESNLNFSLSPPRLAFLSWGDFQACSRFARSTIPEGKWGPFVV